MQPGIQLYTLRNVDEPFLEVLDRVGQTSFEGVEFATRADEEPSEEVTATLAENGLEPISAHVGIEELEEDLEGVVEQADALGYDDVAVPWLDPEHFETVDAVEDAADRLSALGQRLAEQGITLHYHNHSQEFQETEDGPAYHILAERASEVRLQVDTGWVLAGGEDPVDFLRLYEDRISIVHLKDVSLEGDDVPALGEGDLDLEAVAEASREIDAEWLVVENDEPEDPLAELESASEIVSKLV